MARRYTFDDYLADERAAQADPNGLKHEYLAGQAFAMAGASLVHNIIAANVARVLGNRLIAQDRLSIDVYSRAADGRWVLDSANRPDGRINLTALGCDLAVADIYAKVADIRPRGGEPS